MQSRSPEFDAAIVDSHTAVAQCDVIQNGKVVDQLAIHSAAVMADRTAAQMRTFEVVLSDPNGTLAPAGMTSELAPFGTRIQLYRGVRISAVQVQAQFFGTEDSWLPQVSGSLSSVKVASDGGITLGP